MMIKTREARDQQKLTENSRNENARKEVEKERVGENTMKVLKKTKHNYDFMATDTINNFSFFLFF